MSHACLGVRTDEHGNSATIQQEPPLPLEETCRRVHERVETFLSTDYGDEGTADVAVGGAEGESEKVKRRRLRDVQGRVRWSLGVIGESLGRYSLDELSLSYNGGKDCLVLLILYLSALYAHYHKPRTSNPPTDTTPNGPISIPSQEAHSKLPPPRPPPDPSHFPNELSTVYIPPPDPIQAVEDFILSSARTYHLTLSRHPHPMRSAFGTYLAQHPGIRAIFVGTRRTDPHGASLTSYDATDRGWPSFMRVHPVVEWRYAEVWAFLRVLEVPYCGVYDLGYTSLGGKGDTRENPRLAVEGEGGEGYRPAFELVEDEEERLGRDKG